MTKEDIFRAVRDTQLVLKQEPECYFNSQDYDFGVGDALEAVLRHLGLYQEYEVWEGSDV